MAKVLILDGAASDSSCKDLISLYEENLSIAEKFESDMGTSTFFNIRVSKIKGWKDSVLPMLEKNLPVAVSVFGALEFQWANLAKRPQNAWHRWHQDLASLDTTVASITFLNDDFRGGELELLDGTKIAPVKGRTVFFDGGVTTHSVSPTLKKDRYTLAAWYRPLKQGEAP